MRRILLIIIVFSLGVKAYSQPVPDAGAIRESDRSQRSLFEKFQEEHIRQPRKAPEIIEEKPLPEAKEDAVKFYVKQIKLEGLESFSEEDFRHLVEKYEDKNVSLEELNILAKEIEREYLRKGIISACFVPPQDIVEGVVILRVVEAKMGNLEIKEHKYFNSNRLRRYWASEKGKPLRYSEISRSLQFMNKNADRQVRSTLKAGTLPETTDIYLDVGTRFPFHFTYSFDNAGAVTTGIPRQTYGLKYNNFLGWDDSLVLGYQYGSDFSSKYLYHTIPISGFGTSLMLGYTYSKSFPKKEFAASLVDSRSRTAIVYLYQDLYKKDKYLGNVHVGFDAKDKVTSTLTDKPLNKDRLRIVRYGGDFNFAGRGSSTYFKAEVSQGVNAPGSKRRHTFSSRSAKNTFAKLNLELTHKRALPFLKSQVSFKVKGQFTNRKLAPQEQYYLGGIDSVRGYPAGDYAADDAFQINLEFLMPAFFIPKSWRLPYAAQSLRDSITAVAFYDYGEGKKRTISSTERDKDELQSVGLGLRIRTHNQALLRIELGFPIGQETIEEKGDSSLHISLDFEDKLPEEIERIKRLIETTNIEEWVWALLEAEFAREGSPLSDKLNNYRYLAETAKVKGDLETSKAYYEKIMRTSRAIYLQTKEYIKTSIEQKKELQEYNKLAQQSYKEEKYQEAKNIWEKMLKEATIKSLVLEF